MPKREKSASFEERLKKLEEISQKLDDPSFPLEESMELFEKAVKLGRELHTELEASKLRIKKLMESGELDPIEDDFEQNDNRGGND